jgi:hypothetical protein
MRNSTQLEVALEPFLPKASLELACEMLRQYPHHLIITAPRSTKLGDFTADPHGRRHTLTVNGNLNPYAFLITLMHELAHLITYENHKHQVKPHGNEWKRHFRLTLGPFIRKGIFPTDIEPALRDYMSNPSAATCSDIKLSKALAAHDRKSHPDIILLDDVPHGASFKYGRQHKVFTKLERVRTRYRCVETKSRDEYLFNPLVKVLLLK